eukprot:gene3110-6113_t
MDPVIEQINETKAVVEQLNDTISSIPCEQEQSTLPEYYVCVQEKYLVSRKPKNNTNELNVNSSSTPALDESEKKNGTNKKRPRDERAIADEKLCRPVALGENCPYGDTCRFSHDTALYLQNKPPDIGDFCYIYNEYGECSFGLMCRFGNSHIDKVTAKNITRPIEQGGVLPRNMSSMNELPKDIQIQLRKKKYPFKKAKPQQLAGNTPAVTAVSNILSEETSVPNNETDNTNTTTPLPTPTPAPTTTTPAPVTDVMHKKDKDNAKEYFNAMPYDKPVKIVDFSKKVYVAPLTTVGNLPFRRVLKDLGADITCGEMSLAFNLLQGQSSEWALLRRHRSEDVFGVQIAGAHQDQISNVAKVIEEYVKSDFVDINCGCPLDVINNRGAGAALLNRPKKLIDMVIGAASHLSRPITVKIRTGWDDKSRNAHKIVPLLQKEQKLTGRLAAIM